MTASRRWRSSILAIAALTLSWIAAPSLCFSFPLSTFVYPITGPRLSSKFGVRRHPVIQTIRHHSGVDLAAPEGSSIRAIATGTVVFADPYGGYGRLVVIQHAGGITSHYGHCSTIKVKPGQKVKAGQLIALVGSTGITTGPHLHFELRQNGVALNPEAYLPDLVSLGDG